MTGKNLTEDKWACRTLIHVCSLVKQGKHCKSTVKFASWQPWVEILSYFSLGAAHLVCIWCRHHSFSILAEQLLQLVDVEETEKRQVNTWLPLCSFFLENDWPASCQCLSTYQTQGTACLHLFSVRQTLRSILQFMPLQMNSWHNIDSGVTDTANARAHWCNFIALSLFSPHPALL